MANIHREIRRVIPRSATTRASPVRSIPIRTRATRGESRSAAAPWHREKIDSSCLSLLGYRSRSARLTGQHERRKNETPENVLPVFRFLNTKIATIRFFKKTFLENYLRLTNRFCIEGALTCIQNLLK